MGQKFLIDTNVLIDYYGGKLLLKAINLINECLDTSFNISIVTKIETLGFNGVPSDMQGLTDLLSFANVFYLDDEVANSAIQIRKQIKIHLGDAIIAATALTNGFTLLSRNTKDFKNIQGLQIVNPYGL